MILKTLFSFRFLMVFVDEANVSLDDFRKFRLLASLQLATLQGFPAPLPVVRNGQLLRRNMRQELLTEDELMSQLRQQGVGDVSTVKLAYVEPDGGISVVGHSAKRAKHVAGVA